MNQWQVKAKVAVMGANPPLPNVGDRLPTVRWVKGEKKLSVSINNEWRVIYDPHNRDLEWREDFHEVDFVVEGVEKDEEANFPHWHVWGILTVAPVDVIREKVEEQR